MIQLLDSPLAEAVDASYQERVCRLVEDEDSDVLRLFTPEARAYGDTGDWYGEHIGKWLETAALADRRTGELGGRIRMAVDFLKRQQEPDGYLGTYAPGASCRFTSPEASKVRTWDLWVHAWLIRGFLATGEVEAAHRIGNLILATFPTVHPSILDLGNHAGLSSLVLIHPLAELGIATQEERFLRFARESLDDAEKRGLTFLSADDVAGIGTGKAYQILWVLLGMVSLHRATGEAALLEAVERLWQDVADHHLTPMGGPWGGIATHKEVFNARGFFSPYGMVETCSAQTWMELSRALFEGTGKERYMDAVERTLLNTILGAIDGQGREWCYFTFPNGRRNNTYHWACCKSSGALALEQGASYVADERTVNLLVPFRNEKMIQTAGEAISLELDISEPERFALQVRIPGWTKPALVKVGSATLDAVPGSYVTIEREWCPGDRVEIAMEQPIRVRPYTFTVDHHGQEIVRTDYACVSRGPYVYATSLIDGFRKEETLRLPRLTPEAPFKPAGDALELRAPGHPPIPFEPYYRAGGRHDSAWRSVWMQVAWQ